MWLVKIFAVRNWENVWAESKKQIARINMRFIRYLINSDKSKKQINIYIN